MSRPPKVPPPQFPPPRPKAFQRTPPAIFLPILALLGLGLALRAAAEVWGLNGGVAEALLGAATGLGAFAVAAYGAKVVQRPGVVAEDLRILPGRAGLAALVLGLILLAVVLLPYGQIASRGVLVAGLIALAALTGLMTTQILSGPDEGRVVTPVWHLPFTGMLVGSLAATLANWPSVGLALMVVAGLAVAAIWIASGVQLIRRIPPAPLRPLLALHLAPAALFGLAAEAQGLHVPALLAAGLAAAILLALLASSRWMLGSGFSALWGVLGFPLAAHAWLMLHLWGAAGAVLLAAAVLSIPPVAYRIMQDWAKGSLAARTNAATA